MRVTAYLLLVTALGCASGAPGRTSPGVTISQVSAVEPVRVAVQPLDSTVSHAVPVDYDIKVTNPFDYPISLTSVEIETVGTSGAYSLRRVRHAFSLTIGPRSEKTLPIRAWVQPLQESDMGEVNGPVTVRGTANFSSQSGVMSASFAARVQ